MLSLVSFLSLVTYASAVAVEFKGLEKRQSLPTALKSLPGYSGSRYFGSELDAGNLGSDSTYRSIASQQINCATAQNECKFDATEPNNGQYSYSGCDTIQQFIAGVGGKFRLHNFAWYQQLPGWASGLSGSAAQTALTSHITNVMGHYKGKAYAVDVVNEPFNDDGSYRTGFVWYNSMGNNYINIALQTARTADPSALLFINDYNIEGSGAKADAMYKLAQSLMSTKTLDGIGFESHFIVGQVPSSFQSNMQRFAALGLKVAITELDIRMPTPASTANLAQQSTDYKNVASACEAIGNCVGVTTWGFTDKYSWIPGTFSGYGAALWLDSNYAPKPAYTALVQAGSTAGVGGTTTSTTTTTSSSGGGTTTTTTTSSPATGPTGTCAAHYGQCGGTGWTGPTCCSSGTCQVGNPYYSQCL